MRAFIALASALWRYAGSRRLVVVVTAILFILSNVVWLLQPYVIGKILNGVQEASRSDGALPEITRLLIFLVLIDVVSWVFHGPARVLERHTAFRVRAAFKAHLFSIVMSLPVQWHKNHHSGQTINRIGKATNALFYFTQNGFQLWEMVIRPIGAVVALCLILPAAAGIAFGVIAISLFVVFLFDRVLFPLYGRVNEFDHAVASVLHDYVTNITTVITLRLEALTQSELTRRMMRYIGIYRKESRINEGKWFTATLLISLMTATVLGWYAWTTIGAGETLLAGTFFMLYEYLQKIGGAFYTFAWKYGEMVEQYADLKAVDPILAAVGTDRRDHYRIDPAWERIELQNIGFTYKDEEHRPHHLRKVSLTLRRGRTIALIGESGSGKSTLMSLIRGLHTADTGIVTCDGSPLPHGLLDVGSTVTLIPQEPEIFENTIEYNITLDTDQSTEEVMEDVRLARLDRVIERLPKGLQTHTAEKGVNLSGGEKQRLALARGFFAAKQSTILLLDEPTSSVDPANERAIYENLFRKFSDRCIISSLHKLYLLPMFHEAYVFRDGEIVAHGTPAELLAPGGELHGLWAQEEQQKDA